MNKKQGHILIVDDISDNIQVAMNILKEDSYTFSFATNGEEALEIVEREGGQLDLILLDIMMPRLNGFEVCKKIKSHSYNKQIPIIFLSAKVDLDSITQGLELGAVDYISKPFHAAELLARVKTHVELFQAKKILQQNNLALEAKIKFGHERLFSELEDSQKEMIFMLTELMEYTSDETGQHIRRVSEFSALLARHHPSLSEEDEDILYHAAPMHDIGKMTVPHEILHKPGKYTQEEFKQMQAHTVNAYELLKGSKRKFMKAATVIAYQHHEKWDGSGYPQRLKGEEIHIYGRIVALVDVFDALINKRTYKEAWDIDSVIAYIKEHRATHFDPQLVDIFMEHIDEVMNIVKKI